MILIPNRHAIAAVCLILLVSVPAMAFKVPDRHEGNGVEVKPDIKQISFGPCQCTVNYNDKGITHAMDCCNNNCLNGCTNCKHRWNYEEQKWDYNFCYKYMLYVGGENL